MKEANLKRIQTFFNGYRQLEHTFWRQRLDGEIAQFSQFKEKFGRFNNKLQQLRKEEAPFYNIFSILKIGRYETRVHTPFLCHLLDPDGTHEQGPLFLNTFLEQVLGLKFSYESITNFKVHQEIRKEIGQLDILLEFTVQGHRKGILVENKIYAPEQPAQLERYFSYSEKFEPGNFWMVYLTRKGDKPLSIDPIQANGLRTGGVFKEIGYRQHIVPWLKNCYQQIDTPKVRHTLLQYIHAIQEITK